MESKITKLMSYATFAYEYHQNFILNHLNETLIIIKSI